MKSLFVFTTVFLLSALNCFPQSNWATQGSFNYNITCLYFDSVAQTLYAGGGFGRVDNKPIYGIAKWNGQSWDSLEQGLDHTNGAYAWCNVWAICRYHDLLYVGGNFSQAGDYWLGTSSVATWNGQYWDTIQSRINGAVLDIKVFDDTLYMCGSFDSVGTMQVNGLVAYDGINWFSPGLPFRGLYQSNKNMVVSPQFYHDDLYLTGYFYDSVGHQHQMVRRHNGIWDFMPEELDLQGGTDWSGAMDVYNDKLIVSGYFLQPWGNADNNIMAWDGIQWFAMGGGTGGSSDPAIRDILVHQNKLYAVGDFKTAGEIPASRIAVWDGTKWCGLGGAFNAKIMTALFYQDTLFVGGWFYKIDDDSFLNLAKYVKGETVDTCSTPVGISESSMNNLDFRITPNPATTSIQLHLPSNHSTMLTLFNLVGEKVKEQTITGSDITIDVSELPAGMYVVRVEGWSGKPTSVSTTVGKFVKE